MPGAGHSNSSFRIPPAWLWAAAYFAALIFVAPSPDIRHADDYHYLEASLQMAQEGDWIIPRSPEGEPRLRKPVFSYWPLAVSFEVFGYSMWAARLPYILAGALTVWLIGFVGGRLADRDTGRLAAMMFASCLPWLLAGMRTIPDVWLCLFTTLSAGGFLMRLSGEYREGALWAGWIGFGLALATKGMAAFLLLIPVWLASLAVTRDAWRRLVHWRAMAVAAVLGLGWYLAVAAILEPSALVAFTRDQLQATLTAGEVARHAAGYGLVLVVGLMPWSVLALGVRAADWSGALSVRHGRLIAAYAASYAFLLVGVFMFAYQFSGGRYLIPALPWVALGLALAFRQALAEGRPGRWLRGTVTVLSSLAMLAIWLVSGALVAALGLLDDNAAVLARVVAISVALVALVFGTRLPPERAMPVLALLVILFLPVLFAQIRPALSGSAPDIVRAVRAANPAGKVLMADEGSLAGVVRVISGGRIEFTRQLEPLPAAGSFGALVVAGEHLGESSYADCARSEIATDYRRVDFTELVAAIRAGNGSDFMQSKQQPYYLVTCPPAGSEGAISSR